VFSQFGVVNFGKDAYIIVEGRQKAECFFIIQQGKVRLTKQAVVEGEENDELLAPGDFFGVISAMSSHSHFETAQALTDVVLIAVRPQQYVSLIQNNIPVATRILTQFSKQLRFLDTELTKLTRNAEKQTAVAEGPPHLFAVAEYYFNHERYKQAFYAYAKYLKHCPKGENGAAAAKRLKDLSSRVKDLKTEYGSGELTRSFRKGEIIFAEGEPGNEFFAIQRGSVKITKIVDDTEVLLATLKAGDIFGEMALLEDEPRAASALAGENCAVMAINKANFEHMIKTQPQLVARVTVLLADRIWFIFKQLENAQIIIPLGRVYDALLIQLEKARVNLDGKNPYVFNFTWKDLEGMLGLRKNDGGLLLAELLKNKNLQLNEDGKIYSASVAEIVKHADFYRRMDKNKKSQRESRSTRQQAQPEA